MTPLDRLRAAFPEPWDVVAHRTKHITAPTNRGYARAVLFGDLVTVIGRGDTVSAAVDACIASYHAILRPAVERAALLAERDAVLNPAFWVSPNLRKKRAAELCERVLRGEE